MRPFGCFGSSLICNEQTATCSACPELVECSKIVEARRPQLLKLLSRFSYKSGQCVGYEWMTTSERRALNKGRKLNAQAESEIRMFGSTERAEEIRMQMDKRARPLFNRFIKAGVNTFKDKLSVLSSFERSMGVVIGALQQRPHTIKELTALIVSKLNKSEAAAQRDAYVCVSILTVSDRAQSVGPNLELK